MSERVATVTDRIKHWNGEAVDWTRSRRHPIGTAHPAIRQAIQGFVDERIVRRYIGDADEISTKERWCARPKILELGAGGGFGMYCSRGTDVSQNPSIVAVDFATKMFRLGVNHTNGNSGNRQGVIYDVGRGLPFRDGSFDAVVAICLMRYVADQRTLLKQAANVLRPGGEVLLVDIGRGAAGDQEVSGFNPCELESDPSVSVNFSEMETGVLVDMERQKRLDFDPMFVREMAILNVYRAEGIEVTVVNDDNIYYFVGRK